MKTILFAVGLLLLIGIEIALVYYIMPFPGSQVDETVELAYFITKYVWAFRILGLVLIGYPVVMFLKGKSSAIRANVIALLIFWLMVVYAVNFRFVASKMFYQPEHKVLVTAAKNKIEGDQLVLGVMLGNESKAYPIEIIGYHHQVRDTVGGQPIMVTYCTVCRTGRVYSPFVNGVAEEFRLVGMDHFNAMFEDGRTKSWWRQVSGEAITGPLKGNMLNEIPSEQMSLTAWLSRHPDSYILQQDASFIAQYNELKDYDEGKMKGKLERRDSLSWHDKSWVVGISQGLFATAYDWNDLIAKRVINDVVGNAPVVVVLENDSVSFHAWSRVVGNDTLRLRYDEQTKMLTDQRNESWNWHGEKVNSSGVKLTFMQAYQEYWHSWNTFHPQTKKYLP
ncbi:MAG TPA: DUF3179 domain-containing (seleno)protein [Cyclobacteriaceae bacterium]|nr:DUF3179 domain-containing (seleno)protein [Cyclobacteriaceae bacterium]